MNIKPGQVRRFKNAIFDIRFVVLSYTRTHLEKCQVLFLDEHVRGDCGHGQIYDYDHNTILLEMSTECEL